MKIVIKLPQFSRYFSIYRSGSIWKVKAINEGITSSLSQVLKNYGLDSNDNTI